MIATLMISAVTLAASPSTPMPGTAVMTSPDVPWPVGSGLLDFGVKTTSDSYTDGHFSIAAPVYSSLGRDGSLSGSMVFVEPYVSWGEQGEVAASLGLGCRHLFSSQSLEALQRRSTGWLDEGVILGGNLFLDMLDTQHDNRFWQAGFGIELETRYLALRANYYQPLTGRQEAEPILQRDVQRATLVSSGKEPFATGHTIQQDVTFTTYDFYTDRLYRMYEQGLEGWDAEAALLVPGLDRWCELWLIGGYGDFRNQPFGPQAYGTGDIHGWKAGVEFRPVPQLVMSAMWYEDKRMQGGEWMYGIGLQLPLDPQPGNTSKNWWRKLRDTLTPRSRHLAERAIVPVHRQNAAVKVGTSISEPEVTQYAETVRSVERRVVVANDVIFVNNGGAQTNGIAAHGPVEDGTAEHPYDKITEGVYGGSNAPWFDPNRPRESTVFVVGGGPDYVEEVLLDQFTHSTHLVSGGWGIGAFAGQRFGLGIPARLVAPVGKAAIGWRQTTTAQILPIEATNELDGFTVVGGASLIGLHVAARGNLIYGYTAGNIPALSLLTIGTAEARNNVIFGATGIEVFTASGQQAIIADNDVYIIDSHPSVGINVVSQSNSLAHPFEVELSGNRIFQVQPAVGGVHVGIGAWGHLSFITGGTMFDGAIHFTSHSSNQFFGFTPPAEVVIDPGFVTGGLLIDGHWWRF